RRVAARSATLPLDHLQAALVEHLDGEILTVGFEPRKELGDHARPAEGPEDVALLVDARLVEETDVLYLDVVAGDADDLRDVRNNAAAVAESRLLHHQRDATDDLFANGLEG